MPAVVHSPGGGHVDGRFETYAEISRPMNATYKPDLDPDHRLSSRLIDVLIHAALVFALAVLCIRIFSPFISLMAWALLLAVTLYPTHQKLARSIGGKQGLAATLLVL